MPDIKFKFSENEKNFDEIRDGEFTNYMFCMHHRVEGGWMFPRIVPVGEFSFAPDSYAVRFAKTAVDTVKISRDKDGNIVMFRPERVIKRLCDSAAEMRLPKPDSAFLLDALKALADSERGFLDNDAYLSAEITLGAENIKRSDLTILLRYIKKRDPHKSVSLSMVTVPVYGHRALSSSYLGMCMLDKVQARRRELDAPLWLDCVYNRYILSAADMNIFFRTQDALITPDSPTVNGIMRDCVIKLCDSWNINLSVRRFSTDELTQLYEAERIQEIFVTSVRHGIIPVTQIDDMKFEAGKLTHKLSEAIANVEKGTFTPPERWIVRV